MSKKVARRRQSKKGEKPINILVLHESFLNTDKTPVTDTETGKTNISRIAEIKEERMPAIEGKRKRYVDNLNELLNENAPAFDKEVKELADKQGKREVLEKARNAENEKASKEFNEDSRLPPWARPPANYDAGILADGLRMVVERTPKYASHVTADNIEGSIKKIDTQLDDEMKDLASLPASRHAKENDREKRRMIVQKSLDKEIEIFKRAAKKKWEEENK